MFEMVDRDSLDGRLKRLLQLSLGYPGMVSLYFRVGSEFAEARSIRPRLRALLDQPRSVLDTRDLSREESEALRSAIEALTGLEKEVGSHPGRAAVIFESEEAEEHTRLLISDAVWDVGVAGRRPYIRPLVSAVESLRNVAALVVESRSADLIVDALNRPSKPQTFRGKYPRKSNRAGWFALDERRNQQRAREARRKLIDQVVRQLASEERRRSLDSIYLAGQEKVTNEFAKRMPENLGDKCFQIVVDTHTATPADILSQVLMAEQRRTRLAAEKLWEEVTAEATPVREGVVGVAAVAEAANRGAVRKLLISGTDPVSGWECSLCWAVQVHEGDCRLCGAPLVEAFDVLDSITHQVLNTGGQVSQLTAPIKDSKLRTVAVVRY